MAKRLNGEIVMRFVVVWLDSTGHASYAEHFEHPTFEQALKFVARKVNRGTTEKISGFIIDYTDSEFIRRHFVSPGSTKKRTFDRTESDLACKNFPHLQRV
jgi:hypothetical protein